MTYRKAKQKVRRVYLRSKSIFGGDLLKNPYFVGIAAGAIKNTLAGKKIIDIEDIKNRISNFKGRRHKSSDFYRFRFTGEKSANHSDWSFWNS